MNLLTRYCTLISHNNSFSRCVELMYNYHRSVSYELYLTQSCPRVTFLGPDPTRRYVDPTRPAKIRQNRDPTRPDPRVHSTRGPDLTHTFWRCDSSTERHWNLGISVWITIHRRLTRLQIRVTTDVIRLDMSSTNVTRTLSLQHWNQFLLVL